MVPFLRRVAGRPALVAPDAARLRSGWRQASGRRGPRRAEEGEWGGSVRGGATPAVVDEADGADYARGDVRHRLRSEAARNDAPAPRRRCHRRARLGIAACLPRAAGRHPRRDDVLAGRSEARPGRATGRLDGGNCRGPEKVVRSAGSTHAGGRPAVHLSAYGDSRGDRELLAVADLAPLVGRRVPGA